MTKAVFFDFYNTIIRFDPPREELQVRACREFGIETTVDLVRRGYWVADDYMVHENARTPLQNLPEPARNAFWTEYERLLLRAAGHDVTPELASQVWAAVRRFKADYALFDDVIPALSELRKHDIAIGMLSNLHRDLYGLCERLGVASYFDFILTSQEAGSEKPDPGIFLIALDRAGARPDEAIHVGDQVYSDVVGAMRVGIRPLLLDRYGFAGDMKDITRIESLTEVVEHI